MSIGIFFWFASLVGVANTVYLSAQNVEQDRSDSIVLVFLSQNCPCSKGHVKHLNELALRHKNVKFYAVVSEPINQRNKESVQKYFTKERFAFPIVEDNRQFLVRKFGALKTPHVLSLIHI